MNDPLHNVVIIGAGTIGTALGNVIAGSGHQRVLLHSIEPKVVEDINKIHINTKYFPTLNLHENLTATLDENRIAGARVILLAIPSVVMMDYLEKIRPHLPADALLVNLAKGFGDGNKTIVESLKERFTNPVCTLKGPSFAREIINRIPTGFTVGHEREEDATLINELFRETSVYLDHSLDIRGVEILSILKNIYAVALGIVDAQFNSPNLRFLVLTKAFREMRRVLEYCGGSTETLYNYCGYGDFTLTALNDLSRNRTLGLLIGKGFFTEHVSHELVLEGKTAVNVFYRELSRHMTVADHFPILAELHRIFSDSYDVSGFVPALLNFSEQ